MTKQVTILGSTGSIGTSTLDVIGRHLDKYQVYALTAHCQVDRLYRQCISFQPRFAVMVCPQSALRLQELLRTHDLKTEVLAGARALIEVVQATAVDIVMAAIVGAAGLLPNLAAVRAGKKVLLANKESLVISGEIFMAAVRASKGALLPIDSEHNAIFQSLPSHQNTAATPAGIRRILLTASGGPFRSSALEKLPFKTPSQACSHPNWMMGKKVSVDSASMMNKGLELIEACWLFGVDEEQVEVVIHPQSIIHSLVDYVDGSVLAQLGNPDMRIPITYGLAWPQRIDSGVPPLDLCHIGQLDFEKPCAKRFPALQLAKQAMRARGTAPAIFNAANEVAVEAFLAGRLPFTGICHLVDLVLQKSVITDASSIEKVLMADREARVCANTYLKRKSIKYFAQQAT